MRIPRMPQVCSGLLCGLLVLVAGCGNPSSQSLDSLSITATPATVSVGGSVALHAMVHLSDGTTQDVTSSTQFTLSNPSIATLGAGVLTSKAIGTLTVQGAYVEVAPATQSASTPAAPQSLSSSVQVTITAAGTNTNTPTITWNTPAPISSGTALSSTQLNATANMPGSFVYTPAAGTVLKTGTQQLSTTFTPTDTKDYSAATATVQLTVSGTAPVITWGPLAAIAQGTALSATQLNATANVPGAFAYNPAAGAVLPAGTQQLTATFTPTDTTTYATATAHNSLTVTGSSAGPTAGPPLTGCGGPTVNVNAGMSVSTLQSTIQSAPKCALVVFAAGTYNITSTVNIPCASNLTLTGPAVSPATAILNGASLGDGYIFGAGSCTGVTIAYLQFTGAGGIYFSEANNSGITITHNQFYGLPSTSSYNMSAAYFDGASYSLTTSNVSITYNTVGDANSCQYIMNVAVDDNGGYCGGFMFATGAVNNTTIAYNNFFHMEEAIHIFQLQTNYSAGASLSTCTNVTIENNDINQWHRIGMEIQCDTPSSSVLIEHNDILQAYNPFYTSFAISSACCQWASTGATPGYAPGTIDSDNVIINTTTGTSQKNGTVPYGIEFWGNGPIAQNNLLQGSTLDNGVAVGYSSNANVTNNYICGPQMDGTAGSYVAIEEGSGTTPGLNSSSNTTSTSCSMVASTAPTMSPAAGSYSGPQTITLSDAGTNTSIYYTTDGTTPVPGSGTTKIYGGPFSVAASATLKAVGMWGAPNQPLSYPSGYGYGPSTVTSAAYVVSSSVKRPGAAVSSTHGGSSTPAMQAAQATSSPVAADLESITIVPAKPMTSIGSTTQLSAIATFSDGSTKDVTTGFAWKSSDSRTLGVSSSGALTGLASGQATVSGSYQGQTFSVPASSTIGDIEWSGPIVITQGGTYSGNWQSTDGKTPAVTVETTAPVVIQDSHLRSRADLIRADVKGTNITVRNSLGLAVNAASKGQSNGIFLEVTSPAILDVENNYIENARSGVLVHGYSGNRDGKQTIVVRANRARNLSGLLSDGNEGYLPGEGSNRSVSRFLEFDDVQSVPGIDVGWNEVINYPGRSLVSNVIEVYRSSGTANSPLEIHDTYIQGAYPYQAAKDSYDGGGIEINGADDDTPQNASALGNLHDNQVIGTVNYGIAINAGHDNIASNNRVISSGLLPDGTKIAAQHVGTTNRDAHSNMHNGSFYNNSMHDNLIGWTCWASSCAQTGYRNDQYLPASPGDYSNNLALPAQPITLDTEDEEYQLWLNKTASAEITVGPNFLSTSN